MFICYTCEKISVCIECVSNGGHKNHEIKNIKRAKKDIHEIIDQNLYSLQKKIEFYMVEADKLYTKKHEVLENNL